MSTLSSAGAGAAAGSAFGPVGTIAGAGIGALGSIVGGLFSSSGSRYAARKQLQAVRETNAMNYQIAQENNAFNERMWNAQNDYNTPQAQRERLEQAGLNPFLMLDGSSTGTAESSPTADTSGTQQSPDIGNTIASGYNAMGSSISSAASQIANMVYQNDLQQANVAKTRNDARSSAADAEYKELQNQFAAAQFAIDLKLKETQNKISEKDYEFLRDSFQDRLQSQHFDWQLKGNQSSYYEQLAGLTETQNAIEKENLKWLPREKQVGLSAALQNIMTMASQMHLNEAQAKSAIAMAALTYAQENGIRIDNRLKEDVYDLSVGLVENQYEEGRAKVGQTIGGFNLPRENALVYNTSGNFRQMSHKERTPFVNNLKHRSARSTKRH